MAHLLRLLALWRIAAYYRLDATIKSRLKSSHTPLQTQLRSKLKLLVLLIRLHPASWFKRKKPHALKLALESMGTLFLKLGQLLSTRQDLVPPEIIHELVLLQDKVTPFSIQTAKVQITTALGHDISDYFSRFDDKPLAAASIAQVHTGALKDGREVIIKVVRPDIRNRIADDFDLLLGLARWLENRVEAARALHLEQVIMDYRQVLLNELNLELEAANTMKMRNNFLGSKLMYVPQVYFAAPNVMIAERICGVPVSDKATFKQLGYNLEQLAEKGLTIFFTQVFRDNFFHADMHPGNVFVETPFFDEPFNAPLTEPRFIALDCAIVGSLSDQDRLVVARMLLSVMQKNFSQLTQIIHQAGWIPANADQHALALDFTRTVGPMVSKPIDQIDFALVLVDVLDIARKHSLDIPPQLMLLIKTLVHVEGLGRELYPALDIWQLAKPILQEWVTQQMSPVKTLKAFQNQVPDMLMGATDLPMLIADGLHSLRQQNRWHDQQLKELRSIKYSLLENRRRDWLALGLFFTALVLSTQLVWWGALLCYAFAGIVVIWRLVK